MRCCRRIASQSDQTGKYDFLRLQLSSCLRARCNLPARTAFAHSPPVSFLFLCASTSAKPPAATPPHRGTIRHAGTSWVEQKTNHILCANISITLNNTLRNRFILFLAPHPSMPACCTSDCLPSSDRSAPMFCARRSHPRIGRRSPGRCVSAEASRRRPRP